MRGCRHPLVVTLANTREVLYLANRSGNRPSHENAAVYFDRSISLCRRAGFRRVLLRGDTDFSQTTQLDRWDADNVEFVFGMDAMPNLVEIAENLPDSAWRELQRAPKSTRKTQRTRARRGRRSARWEARAERARKVVRVECRDPEVHLFAREAEHVDGRREQRL